ncbi:hypothetical protein B0H19DRAFT_1123285 [Mycena capillaripes]|nr:hypothetical protein B0H19DRAFT_1123285 [Mycena capillaripes]
MISFPRYRSLADAAFSACLDCCFVRRVGNVHPPSFVLRHMFLSFPADFPSATVCHEVPPLKQGTDFISTCSFSPAALPIYFIPMSMTIPYDCFPSQGLAPAVDSIGPRPSHILRSCIPRLLVVRDPDARRRPCTGLRSSPQRARCFTRTRNEDAQKRKHRATCSLRYLPESEALHFNWPGLRRWATGFLLCIASPCHAAIVSYRVRLRTKPLIRFLG